MGDISAVVCDNSYLGNCLGPCLLATLALYIATDVWCTVGAGVEVALCPGCWVKWGGWYTVFMLSVPGVSLCSALKETY